MRETLILLLLLAVAALPSIAQAQTPETIEYYATDAIGSVRIVFRPDGATVARQDYAPFGRPLFPAPAMPKEGFGAQEKDDETDQGYFHARMFQAQTGRFGSVDPIFSGLFEPQRWNRYAYAKNNPVSLGDFDGLDPIRVHTRGCDQAEFWAECMAQQAFNAPFLETLFTSTRSGFGLGGGRGGSQRGPASVPAAPTLPSTVEIGAIIVGMGETIASTARCASELSDSISLAYWAGGDDSFTLQTLLGNDVASASNLAFGPNRVDALRDNAIDNISDDYSLMGVAGKGLSQIKVRPETIPLKQTSSGMWESIKYNTGTLAETALGTVGGKILGFLTVVKLGYDVGTFGGAAAVCAKQ